MAAFPDGLNAQVGYEFAASQQYVAIAVHYDAQTLPRLAAHFYRQAVEERNHAMMIVQYLLDADEAVTIPGVEAPQTSFGDVVEPVRLALEQEKRVTQQISDLVKLARTEGDLVGEQFLHWFLQEQREEVSSMGALLAVVERSRDNVMLIEDYLADIDTGYYVTSYLRAWAFAAQMTTFLREEFGTDWFKRREAGLLLTDLWALGQKPNADELLRDVTGSPVEMEAIAEQVRSAIPTTA